MIVRQFISWIRTAPAGERAEATRALARAWLISDLTEDDRAAAEGALLMMLDDASPLVRQAMAEVFAHSAEAPADIVQALSLDQASVAVPILEHSPLLIDAALGGPRPDRKSPCRPRAVFMGSHRRAPRPSRRDPGIDAGAGRPARRDAGCAGRQAVGHAGAVRCRT